MLMVFKNASLAQCITSITNKTSIRKLLVSIAVIFGLQSN